MNYSLTSSVRSPLHKRLFDSDTRNSYRQTIDTEVYEPVQALASQLKQYLQEFKRESLALIVERPYTSLFDFVVSQQFNDLWNILTVCEDHLEFDQKEQDQPPLPTLDFSWSGRRLTRRSRSQQQLQHRVKEPCIASLPSDLEFVLTQQLLYQMQKHIRPAKAPLLSTSKTYSSPSPQSQKKKRNDNLPQLFSFDSSFVKDLPLSRHPYTSNFDQDNFNMTMGGQLHGTLANISGIVREEDENELCQPTSRFEEPSGSLQNSIYLRSAHRIKQLEDREKDVATKELKVLVKEKQLLQLKEQLSKEKQDFLQQYQQFENDRTQFYVFREQELNRLQFNTQQLEQLEQSIKLQSLMNRKENMQQNTLGHMKGHLKTMVEKMRK